MPSDFLNLVVNNGCKNLRLHCVKIAGDSLNLINPSRLRCLDLTHCSAKVGVLKEILSSCQNVEKLFLSYAAYAGLSDDVDHDIPHLVHHLTKLKEFGLRHHKFSEESFEHLVNSLPTIIEKLGLVLGQFDVQFDVDKHIKTLVSRCKNLTALSLIGIQITDNTLDSLIEHLKPNMLEFRTNSPRIHHAVKVQILLTSMPKLKILKNQME